MRTNTDITIYHKSIDSVTRTEVWTPEQVCQVFWEDRKAANVLRSGLLEADSVAVYIPFAREPSEIKPGDLLVKGLVYNEIDTDFTVTALKKAYRVVTVRSVDTMDYGNSEMRHWQLGAA